MSSLLVVGASKAGKTVYGAQFYLRTQAGAVLTSEGEADDLSIFHKAIEAITHGKKPERTKDDESRTLTLQVRDVAGRLMALSWPDYAGESFGDLLKRRIFTEEWLTRVQGASGMLLMIRPDVIDMPVDALNGKRKTSKTKAVVLPVAEQDVPQERLVPLLPDARYVEWLQMMRHLRGEGRLERSDWPLTVMLSCWDELRAPGTPAQELQRSCPLLASYLRGIWNPESMRIYGVSALGQSFDHPDQINRGFLEKRPEEQGYVVTPEGTRQADLTLPVAWVLERLHGHAS
jgi:Double-GTPase 1